jgi:hypothetical protein
VSFAISCRVASLELSDTIQNNVLAYRIKLLFESILWRWKRYCHVQVVAAARSLKVAELAAEVKRLAKKLESKTRNSKRSATALRARSSRKIPAELQRPSGHEPASKPTPEKFDRIVEVSIIPCPSYQCELENVEVHYQYQSELPRIVSGNSP